MSPSSAGRQRRSLPRSGSPSWGAFLFGQRAGAFGRTGRKFGDASGKISTVAACGIPRKGSLPPGRARWWPVRPPFRSRSAVDTGRSRGKASRPPGKERLFTSGACHLRAFGLWKLVHRSTLRQRPGVPGNALRRIFRCLPVMGPGVAAGRVAGSGPVWKITTLLED